MVVCFSKIKCKWEDELLMKYISSLPVYMQNTILRLQRWQDRQLAISGKLLLLQVINQCHKKKLSLNQLEYNQNFRPFFDTDFDFNISHSGDISVCVGSNSNKVGIDIEKVQKIDLFAFRAYFTESEWATITTSENKIEIFYNLWVRKEALAKAIGLGLSINLKRLDVTLNEVLYQGVVYHLQDIVIAPNYKSCVVSSSFKEDLIKIEVLI